MDIKQFEVNDVMDENEQSFNEDQLNDNKIVETLNNIFMSNADNNSITYNKQQQVSSRKQSFEETTFGNSDLCNCKPKSTLKKSKFKLYICMCGKVYKSKENQILHYKNIHLKIKPYHCSFCEAQFSHRNGKTYHERKFHTFILPYTCPHENCSNLAFASKSALTIHLKSKHSKIQSSKK